MLSTGLSGPTNTVSRLSPNNRKVLGLNPPDCLNKGSLDHIMELEFIVPARTDGDGVPRRRCVNGILEHGVVERRDLGDSDRIGPCRDVGEYEKTRGDHQLGKVATHVRSLSQRRREGAYWPNRGRNRSSNHVAGGKGTSHSQPAIRVGPGPPRRCRGASIVSVVTAGRGFREIARPGLSRTCGLPQGNSTAWTRHRPR